MIRHVYTFAALAITSLVLSASVATSAVAARSDEVREVEGELTVAPGVTLGCTTALPAGEGPFPGAVLLTVAGPNDRDQTVGKHRGFRDLAHGLADIGVASQRCDDRGMGSSSGELLSASYADLAAEALARLRALAARPEVATAQVGFVGNSEGGAIGPLAAALDDRVTDKRVAFVVLLAGPGVQGAETLRVQLESAIVTLGIAPDRATQLRDQYSRFLEIQARDPADPETGAEMRAFLAAGGRTLFPPYAFVPSDVDGLADYLLSPWHRSMVAHDPATVLDALEIPVLALAGDKDQVLPPAIHLEAIRRATAGNAAATVELVPGLNHLFQRALTGSPLEYAMLPEAISPSAVSLIGEWIVGRFGAAPNTELAGVE